MSHPVSMFLRDIVPVIVDRNRCTGLNADRVTCGIGQCMSTQAVHGSSVFLKVESVGSAEDPYVGRASHPA